MLVAKRHGKRPQFWADIALEHPEALSQLPENLIGLAWGYEPDAPFAKWCDQLRTAGREVWVCPGTSCWRSITGRTTERQSNMLAAARDGASHGAAGYLVTAWGDLGHRQQWPITLHALAEGAHRAWSGELPYDSRVSSLHAFADHLLFAGTWLDRIGDLDLELRKLGGRPDSDNGPRALRNAGAIFTDSTKALTETWLPDLALWNRAKPTALAPPTVSSALLNAEFRLIADTVEALWLRGFLRRQSNQQKHLRLLAGMNLRPVLAEHRRLWLERSRPGGLDASCTHYQRLIDELEAI